MPNLPNISPELIQIYREEIEKRTSGATAKRKMSSLRKFFDWAHKEGHVEENPIQKSEVISTLPPVFPSQVITSQAQLETEKKDQKKEKKRVFVSKKAVFAGSFTMAMIILLLLLIGKVQIPIPFRKAPASDKTPTIVPSKPGGTITLSPWSLYARMSLTKKDGSPVSGTQNITFKIYKSENDTTPLLTAQKQITTSAEGNTLIQIDDVPAELFFENEKLYLAAEIEGQELDKRLPVSTANVSSNLDGFYPAQEAGPNTIPVLSSDGSLLLAAEAPSIKAENGNLLVEAQTLTLATPTASDGDINITPGGSGTANFIFQAGSGNLVNATSSNLNSGSLFYGSVTNNSTGYNLLELESGSSPTTKFSVDSEGDTFVAGTLNVAGDVQTGSTTRITSSGALENITGYEQTSGNFSITQEEGNTFSVRKDARALSDLATLTLDERGEGNSIYSTLVLNRYDGAGEAMALLVNEGNAQFNGQVRLGRYATNPASVGTGSLVYNSSDGNVYVWNGSSWVAIGGSGVTIWTRTSGVIHSSTTTDDLAIGGTDSTSPFYVNDSGVITFSSDTNLYRSSANTLQTDDNLTVGGNLDVNGTSNDIAGTLNLSGNTLTSSGDLTIDPTGGGVKIGTGTPGTIDLAGDDLYVTGDLEVDGIIYGNGSGITGVTATSLPFSGITTGTNTTAAMTVDTGASLNYANSGTINASSLETLTASQFLRSDTTDNYTSGTLTFDAGTTLNILGTWQIGSTTVTSSATELNYLDGTTVTAGGVIYANGTYLANSGAGSTDQLLTSSGAGSPTWQNIASLLTSGADISITGTTNATIANTSTLSTVVGRGPTTTDLVNLNGGIVSQGARIGKALVILDETGDQDILTASSSAGTTRFRIANNGDVYVGTGTFNNPSANEDAYVTGNLEVDGVIYGDGSGITGVTADSVSFTNITTGINTTATMTIDTGASLNYANSGTINASSLETYTSSQFLRSDTSDNFTSGTLTTDAGTTLDVNGDLAVADTDITFDGATTTFTTTGDLTLSSGGGDVILPNLVTINIGGNGSDVAYNVIGDTTTGASANVDSDNDLYIEGNLEVDGTIYGNVSGTIDPGFTQGSVIFQGPSGLAQDNANFYWDDTNDKLGIGRTPVGKLDVNGAVVGKALAIFDETGDQNIIAASASGITKATLDRSGNLTIEGQLADLTDATLTINDALSVIGTTLTIGNGSAATIQTTDAAIVIDSGTANSISLGTSDNFTLTGTLNANGGTIATNQAVFNLVNTTATTLNIGGDATAIELGAATGTTSINNTLTVDGNTTLGDVNTDTVTFNARAASNLEPTTDSTYNLGSASLKWANVYADNLIGTISPGFTQGSVVFANASGDLAQDNANFYWDDTNDKLGIGRTPIGKLDVNGAVVGKALAIFDETGDQDILTASSSGDTVFKVANNGDVTVGSGLSGSTPEIRLYGYAGGASRGVDIAFINEGRIGIQDATGGTNELILGSSPSYGGVGYIDSGGNYLQIRGGANNKTSIGLATTTLPVNLLDIAGGTAIGSYAGVNTAPTNGLIVSGQVGIGTNSPTSLLHTTGAVVGKALAIFDETGDQNILTASASSVTVANLDRSGNLAIEGQLSDLTDATLTINDALSVIGTTLTIGNGSAATIQTTDAAIVIDSGTANSISLGASDDFTLTGTLNANGGTIATNQAIFNLVNTTATTLNIGGDATAIELGAATGTTSVNNSLTVDGDVTLGNTSGDTITFTGQVASDIVPSADDTYDLGSATNRWQDLYVTNLNVTDTNISGTTSETFTIDTDDTGGDLSFIFGTTNNERLTWDSVSSEFDLTDDLNITGNLISSGVLDINGAGTSDIASTLNLSGSSPQLTSTNDLIINSTGGDIATDDRVTVGTQTPGVGQLNVSGTQIGKALVILNDTGTDQNILTASASSVTVANLDRSGNLAIEGTISDLTDTKLIVDDDLQINGNNIFDSGAANRIQLGSTITLSGDVDITQALSVDGNTTLGTDASDVITFNATVAQDSDLIPFTATGTNDLGSSANRWDNIYGITGNFSGTVTVDDLSCTDCLDFTEFANNMTLDEATDIALGALTLSTSGTGALDFNSTGQVSFAGNVNAENGLDVTTANLTVGGANFTVDQATGDITTAGDIAINGGNITSTGDLDINPAGGDLTIPARATVGSGTAGVGKLTVTGAEVGKALLILDETGNQNILTASASGATVANLTRTGDLELFGQGDIRLYDLDSSHYTGFQATDTTTQSVVYKLPATDATTVNQVLASDTAGNLNWIDISAGSGSLWTDGGTFLYPTNRESARIYDSGGTDYIDIAHDGTDATLSFANTTALNINIGTIDLSAQTVDVTLNNAVDALNFDTNTLSINALNNRVGIGTASPGYELDVLGNARIQQTVANTTSILHLEGTGDTTASYIRLADTDANISWYIENRSGSSNEFQIENYDGTNWTQPFRIEDSTPTSTLHLASSGNVGIGDSTPDGKLDVEAIGAVTTSTYGINLSNLVTNTTTDGINKYGAYITSTGGFGGLGGTTTNNWGLYVDTVSGADNNYGAYIAGNVGIGNTAPALSLEVGDITLGVDATNGVGIQGDLEVEDFALLGAARIGSTGTDPGAGNLYVEGNTTVAGSSTLGDAATDTNTLRGLITLTDSATSYPLRFGADVDLYRGTTNRLDLATGDSFNIVSGDYTQSSAATTGNAASITANSLISGNLLSLTSTSTALTSGGILSLDWSPGSTVNATGDLFAINIGQYGNVGNLFNIKDNGSSLFSVSETTVTSNLPTTFTSSGDVSVAYDLIFTNQTSSNIKTYAPFTLEVGESFESNDLTLKTYNSGDIVLDSPGGVTLAQAQSWDLADSSTTSLTIESGLMNFDTTNSRVGIGDTSPTATLTVGDGDKFQVAGATGDITTTGDIAVNGGDITSSGALNITPGGALTVGATGQNLTLQGAITSITSNGASNDITLTSADNIFFDDVRTGAIPFSTTDTSLTTPTNAIVDAINEAYNAAVGGSGGVWTRDAGTGNIYPTTISDKVGIGTTTPADIISKLFVTGNSTLTGKAVAIFNQTEAQDIFTASASSAPRLALTNAGNLSFKQASTIDTSTGNLTLGAAGNLVLDSTGGTVDINDAIIDTSSQATNIDIINTNTAALTFETDLLRLDTTNTSVEVTGTTNLGDGGTTNYLQISSGGNLSFVGSASTIDKVSGTLNVNTANNQAVTTGTGLLTTGGDITVNGGDLLTNQTTFNLINTTATTLNIGGAATTALNIGNGNTTYTAINLGSGTGGNTINIAGTGATGLDTINLGTGATGADVINIGSANAGNVTIRSNAVLNLTGSTNSIIDFPNFDVATTGNITTAGDLAVNGDDITGDGTALTINVNGASSGNLVLADTDTLNVGGLSGYAYSSFASGTDAKDEAAISADNDVYIGGDLEVDGIIYGAVSGSAGSVKWNAITDPDGALSLGMGTNTTTFNWATGTSTNNLFSLTTDASANGTGSLLNIQTGTSSTVLPLRVRAGATEGLTVDASGNVGIGDITPTGKLQIAGDEVRIGDAGTVDYATGDGDLYIEDQLEVDGNTYLNGDIYFGTVDNASIQKGTLLAMAQSSGNWNVLGFSENRLTRADEKYTTSVSPACDSGNSTSIFDNNGSSSCLYTSWVDGVSTSVVTIDMVGTGTPLHYWTDLSINVPFSRRVSGVKVEKYYDIDSGDGWSCNEPDNAWSTIYEDTSNTLNDIDVKSGLGNGICQFKVTFSGTANMAGYLSIGEISGYQYYYGPSGGGFVATTGDTIYGDLAIGTSTTNRNLTVSGNSTLGNAATDTNTLRGLITLTDSATSYPLRFGADVDLYRGTTNRLDLATGDSFNIVSGDYTQSSAATTGNAASITANSLTSGKALNLSSTATAFTGNLIDATLSGSNAANTGSLLSLTNSGTLNTGTSLYLKHYATGTGNLALRVDDVSGDTTPFIIDGDGNVGIGNVAPALSLEVGDITLGVDAANGVGIQGDLEVEDFALLGAVRVGSTGTDPGAGNLYVEGDITVAGGDITTTSTTLNIDVANTGTINFRDGTYALAAVKDQGDYVFWNLKGKSDTGNPATCAEGDIYYNAFDDTVYVCHSGNTWEQLDGGGSGTSVWSDLTDPTAPLSLAHNEHTSTFTWDTAASSAAFDAFTLAIKNDATTDGGNQRLLVLANNDDAGSTGTTENLLVLDNKDANEAVTTALQILASSTGTITTAIDVSDAEIVTALSAGANDLTGTNWSIAGGSGNLTSAGVLDINGGGTSDIAGTLNLSGNALNSTGDLTINAGGGQIIFADGDTLNIGGLSGYTYNSFASGTDAKDESAIAADNDVYIGGDIEVDGSIYSGTSLGFTLSSATGSSTDPWTTNTNYTTPFYLNGTLTTYSVLDSGVYYQNNYTSAWGNYFRWSRNSSDGFQQIAELKGSDSDQHFNLYDGTTGTVDVSLSGSGNSYFREGNLGIGNVSPVGKLDVSGAVTGKALAIFDETGDQAILTASASGTPVMTLGRTGNLSLTNSGASNIDFNLSSSGDFTISDGGTPFATFTDGGVFQVDSLNFDGTTIGHTSDTDLLSLASTVLTVNGDLRLANTYTIEVGGLTGVGYNAFSDVGGSPTNPNVTLDNDVYIQGDLDVGGTLYVGGSEVANYWTLSDPDLYPNSVDYKVGIGTSSPISRLHVATNTTTLTGKSALIVDQLEGEDILTASASGQTKLALTNSGTLQLFNATSSISNTSGDITIDAASGTISFAGDDISNIGTVTAGTGIFTSVLQVADSSALAYSRLGMDTTGHGANITAGDDLLISGDFELNGNFFLDGGVIANSAENTAISLTATPESGQNLLSASAWLVENTVNVGLAALTVNQTQDGDIFTASASGAPKVVIDNSGNLGIGTTTPSFPLEVLGSSAGSYAARLIRTTTATNSLAAGLDVVAKSTGDMTDGFGAGLTLSIQDDAAGPNYVGGIYAAREGSDTQGQLRFLTRGSSWQTNMILSKDGNLGVTGSINAGSTTNVAYSRFGTSTTSHIGNLTDASDVLLQDLEVNGVLYLDGRTIADTNGTITMLLCSQGGTNPCTDAAQISKKEHTLGNGSWIISNDANVGKAALIVDQTKGGDIFTASSAATGAVNAFIIRNDGDVEFGDGTGTDLTVGGGSGKIDVGTVDPVYNIGGTKYATYMAGMVGVKEEVTGKVDTTDYVAGKGYRKIVDFKTLEKGSDLWLFSRTTDLKTQIKDMIVLLSASGDTRTWYEVDEQNYTLSIYASRPTSISYRLTAPRFDSAIWTNYNDNDSSVGFILADDEFNVQDNGDLQEAQDNYLAGVEIQQTQESSSFFENPDLSNFAVKDSLGNIIEGFQIVSKLIAANVKAGAIESKEIVTDNLIAFQGTVDNLLVKSGLVSPTITTELISPIADKNVTVDLDNSETKDGSSFGKLIVEGENNKEVASIDAQGNATFSGTVEADKVKTEELNVGKIYADEIIARNGKFGEVSSATTSAVTLEQIEALLAEAETDQRLLASTTGWDVNTATTSAVLDEIATTDLYVTNQAAINALSVSTSVVVGNDFSIQTTTDEAGLLIATSLNTLTAPLQIQSLALAPVEIMAGLIRIETNGDVSIQGNLYVAGKIQSSGLTLVQDSNIDEASDSAIFKVLDDTGNKLASIDASGSAYFDKLVLAGSEATTSATLLAGLVTETNATAGSANIPAGTREITIKSPKITDYTLVYVTPTSETENNVLYVKAKGNGFFTAGFKSSLNIGVSFNWWVIDVENPNNNISNNISGN